MSTRIIVRLAAGVALFALAAVAAAQEVPIATGGDDTFCSGVAFDGTNFLVAILGDTVSSTSITAQFVSRTGLVGPRISLGRTGGYPRVAFDGTNYMLVWIDKYFSPFSNNDTDSTGTIYAQFIAPSGARVGSPFVVATGANLKFNVGDGEVAYHDTTYLVTFTVGGKSDAVLYCQRIGRSGSLAGGPMQISTSFAREAALAFDGTNYLVVWNDAVSIYGQFISKSGTLVGSNFVIDQGSSYAGSPIAIAYDGSRFVVAFHEFAGTGSIYGIIQWTLFARFVSTSGSTISDRVTICDPAAHPFLPMMAFDGTNYLFTWVSMASLQIQGRFFDAAGAPVGAVFPILDSLMGKFPVGGVALFDGDRFIVGATRVNSSYADGDAYSTTVISPATGVSPAEDQKSQQFSLLQNFPNPFNPSTTFSYRLPANSNVSLTVYDLLGRNVSTLVSGLQQAGNHTILFRADGLASGIYVYRLQAGNLIQTKKFVLVR